MPDVPGFTFRAETDNHDYMVPDPGSEDWHLPLNDNFRTFDTDIEIRDTASNRSNYDPKVGAKFLATDTEEIFVGDGSNWNKLDTSGRSPRFEGLNVGASGRGVAHFASPGGNYAVYAQSQQASLGSAIVGINTGDAGDGIQAVSRNDGRSAVYASAEGSTDYGVYSRGDVFAGGDVEVTGSASVEGSASVGDVGVSAEQDADIAIGSGPTDVVYDTVVVDDRSEYDPNTGVFTAATAGDFHVNAQVFWSGTPSEGENMFLAIRRNGSAVQRDSWVWPTSTSSGQRVTQSVSKTLRNLDSGDRISITAQHGDSGNTHDIIGIGNRANLQISKIG